MPPPAPSPRGREAPAQQSDHFSRYAEKMPPQTERAKHTIALDQTERNGWLPFDELLIIDRGTAVRAGSGAYIVKPLLVHPNI